MAVVLTSIGSVRDVSASDRFSSMSTTTRSLFATMSTGMSEPYLRVLVRPRSLKPAVQETVYTTHSDRTGIRTAAHRLDTSINELDQTHYRKSVDQPLALLQVLKCDVDLVVRTKTA